MPCAYAMAVLWSCGKTSIGTHRVSNPKTLAVKLKKFFFHSDPHESKLESSSLSRSLSSEPKPPAAAKWSPSVPADSSIRFRSTAWSQQTFLLQVPIPNPFEASVKSLLHVFKSFRTASHSSLRAKDAIGVENTTRQVQESVVVILQRRLPRQNHVRRVLAWKGGPWKRPLLQVLQVTVFWNQTKQMTYILLGQIPTKYPWFSFFKPRAAHQAHREKTATCRCCRSRVAHRRGFFPLRVYL